MSQAAQPPRESDIERVERLMQEKGMIGSVKESQLTSEDFPHHRAWNVTISVTGQSRISINLFLPYADPAPTPAFALNTWLQDISHIVDGSSYEQWCDEYIFDPHDRRVQGRYKRAKTVAAMVEAFLGEDLDLFLYGEH